MQSRKNKEAGIPRFVGVGIPAFMFRLTVCRSCGRARSVYGVARMPDIRRAECSTGFNLPPFPAKNSPE